MDKTPADLEPLSHEAARLQTPPPAQLTPGWQQVRQEAEAGHTAGMCSCSLLRWFFLKKKAGLSSFLSKTHVALLAPSLAPSQEGSEAEGCPLFCPIQDIVSQNPQQLKNNKTMSLPGFIELLSILVTPSYIITGDSTPNVSEEMGLKRSRNLSSQLPQMGLN